MRIRIGIVKASYYIKSSKGCEALVLRKISESSLLFAKKLGVNVPTMRQLTAMQ